jgi:hypothetical protein
MRHVRPVGIDAICSSNLSKYVMPPLKEALSLIFTTSRQSVPTSQALWDPPDYEGEIAPALESSICHKIRKKVQLLKLRAFSFD